MPLQRRPIPTFRASPGPSGGCGTESSLLGVAAAAVAVGSSAGGPASPSPAARGGGGGLKVASFDGKVARLERSELPASLRRRTAGRVAREPLRVVATFVQGAPSSSPSSVHGEEAASGELTSRSVRTTAADAGRQPSAGAAPIESHLAGGGGPAAAAAAAAAACGGRPGGLANRAGPTLDHTVPPPLSPPQQQQRLSAALAAAGGAVSAAVTTTRLVAGQPPFAPRGFGITPGPGPHLSVEAAQAARERQVVDAMLRHAYQGAREVERSVFVAAARARGEGLLELGSGGGSLKAPGGPAGSVGEPGSEAATSASPLDADMSSQPNLMSSLSAPVSHLPDIADDDEEDEIKRFATLP